MNFDFSYQSVGDDNARYGVITTPHGLIETPNFIFCATKAALKSVPVNFLELSQTQVILANTYHLMLQPGAKLVKQMGGLHKFMGWDGPMLTDSGGFQIFSLGYGSVASEIKRTNLSNKQKTLIAITEEGAAFRSYIDGSKHLLTPEKSIQVQVDLGADLIVVLDECTPLHVSKDYTAYSMDMSHRWALRSLEEFKRQESTAQALYGVIQGGIYPDLRLESCDFNNQQAFFGNAIGGCLGKDKAQMYEVVKNTTALLNPDRPRHLLGIGGIGDIIQGVRHGIDTFDCVHPTRLARHGGALVWPYKTGKESISLKNSQFRTDETPIDAECSCYTCQKFSKAYLHHLLKSRELLINTLLTIHNIAFMNNFMLAIRKSLKEGTFSQNFSKDLYNNAA